RLWRYIDNRDRDADGQQVEDETKNLQPARDDAQLFAKLRPLFLPSQTDHPHPLVPCIRNPLTWCAHNRRHLLPKIFVPTSTRHPARANRASTTQCLPPAARAGPTTAQSRIAK